MVEDTAQEMKQENRQKQQSDVQPPAFDIEDFIVGLYVLVKQAVVTLYDVVIHPARVSEEIKHGGREKRYLRPFTLFGACFLCICPCNSKRSYLQTDLGAGRDFCQRGNRLQQLSFTISGIR